MGELWKAIAGFFSHDEAFGLPKGTVRGIVFIMLTLTMCRLAKDHVEILDSLKVAFGAAIVLYFQKPSNGNGTHGGPHVPPPQG